jgi:Cu/Ag efflux pump CusA
LPIYDLANPSRPDRVCLITPKDVKMNTRYQGFALIVSAIVSLITTFVDLGPVVNIIAVLCLFMVSQPFIPFSPKAPRLG